MTDAGPLDLLVELRDRDGGRHSYGDLVERAVRYEVGGLAVAVASLDDQQVELYFNGVARHPTIKIGNCFGFPEGLLIWRHRHGHRRARVLRSDL